MGHREATTAKQVDIVTQEGQGDRLDGAVCEVEKVQHPVNAVIVGKERKM